MIPPIHTMRRRDGELLLPDRISNSNYGLILNVKWFQMYFFVALAVLEQRFTLTFKLAPALNFYAE